MKWRYFIVDTLNGVITGTNNEETARDFAGSEDYYVVDAKEGLWLDVDGSSHILKHES